MDITDELKVGEICITIRIANSLQNLLGPHDADTNQHLVTPGSFYTDNPSVFESFGFDGNGWLKIEE